MKKLILVLTALFTITVSASAMSYEQARNEALFLTDKMAYELNLTDDQYEAAYEVNLDYLMSIGDYDDVYSSYWTRRNMDLSYILYDWQYDLFCNANYFYRPLYWGDGYWHFRIYSRYPTRSYYYFGRPDFYATYRGGHGWRSYGNRSYYNGRSFGRDGYGMRDNFDRGGYRGGNNNGGFGNSRGYRSGTSNHSNDGFGNRGGGYDNNRNGSYDSQNRVSGNERSFGNSSRYGRESSTRTTVTRGNDSNSPIFGGSRGSSFGSNRGSESGSFRSSGTNTTPTPRSFSTPSRSGSSSGFSSGSSNFGGSRSSGSSSFGGTRSGGGSSFGGNSNGGGSSSFGGGHFGGGRR